MENPNNSELLISTSNDDINNALTTSDTAPSVLSNSSVDLLLQQNADLEVEIKRLCAELDEATRGILKRGYLHKWRDREMSYASKWGLRYFELKGSSLSYFEDDHETRRPRRTIDLSNCVIKDEGTKKLGMFHVFSVYLADNENCERGPTSGALLRLSSTNQAEAEQWIHMLNQACEINNLPEEEIMYKSQSLNAISLSNATYLQDEQHATLSPLAKERYNAASTTLLKLSNRRKLHETAAGIHHPFTKTQSKQDSKDSTPDTKTSKKKSKFNPKTYPASKPIHVKNMSSPLSTDVRPGEQNYRGFFHLGVIIFMMTHCRLIVDNLTKYGFLFQFPSFENLSSCTIIDVAGMNRSCHDGAILRIILVLLSWMTTILSSYLIELIASLPRFRNIPDSVIVTINFIAGFLNIYLPCFWVWRSNAHPLVCMIYLFQSVVLWMKMISYVHVNRDVRLALALASTNKSDDKAINKSHSEDVNDYNNAKPIYNVLMDVRNLEPPFMQYPNNLTLIDIAYFSIAPTLCYQLNYPRSPKIRWNYIITILIRLVIVSMIMLFFIEQYIVPTLEQSIVPMRDKHIWGLFNRLLRLSVPNTYVWLLSFYGFFHLWLNLLAELTRFGDRLFYKDWWNARTIDNYWRSWNLPVHHWMLRHLYYPLLRLGVSKIVAVFVVFFFSAAFHELVISVPFRRVSYHAFLGMLAQVPLVFLTKRFDEVFDNSLLGNVFFWLIFCIIGQPMGIIMYYYDIWNDSHH